MSLLNGIRVAMVALCCWAIAGCNGDHGDDGADDGGGCTTRADCPSGEVCVDGECLARSLPGQPGSEFIEGEQTCSGDNECGADRLCSDGRCRSKCALDGSCPSDLTCDYTRGVCASDSACRFEGDCLAGLACHEGDCLPDSAVCTSDSQCSPPQTVCASELCQPGCLTTGCEPPATCNTGFGHCELPPRVVGAACTTDGDCADGDHCLGDEPGGMCTRACPTGVCPAGAVCAQMGSESRCLALCTQPADCRAEYSCYGFGGTSTCVGPCASDDDCPGSATCRNGSCRPKSCAEPSDCSGGEVCRPYRDPDQPGSLEPACGPPLGSSPAGSPCAADHQCQSGICLRDTDNVPVVCLGLCNGDEDCPTGTVCGTASLPVPGGVALVPGCMPVPGPRCHDDANCGDGHACVPLVDPSDPTQLATFCDDAVGSAPAGAACQGDSDCRSGICLRDANGDPFICYGACNDDQDCVTGETCQAEGVYFRLPSGEYGAVPACIP